MDRPANQRSGPSKRGPEGLLLFVLVISVLITLTSMLIARHPAASAFAVLAETKTESQGSQ